MELDHAILLLEPLTFVMSRLLDQICRRLRVRIVQPMKFA